MRQQDTLRKHRVRRLLITVTSVVTTLITGCVAFELKEYPEDWPKPSTTLTEGCPDLAGKYRDLADDPQSCTPGEDGRIGGLCSLGAILEAFAHGYPTHDYSPDHFRGRVTEISPWEDGVLTVRISKQDSTVSEHTLWLDDESLDCSEGRLVSSYSRWDGGGVALLYGNRKATLSLAEDGSLIGKVTALHTGLITMIIPAYVRVRHWTRWVRADPDNMEPRWLTEVPSSPIEAVQGPAEAQSGRLRVALLPIEQTSTNTSVGALGSLSQQAKQVINNTPELVLVESDQMPGSALLAVNSVWNRLSALKSEPNLEFIYSQDTQAWLDVAVMISFSSDYMGYMYYEDAELYVIDLRRRQVLEAHVPTQVDALDI